MLLNNLSVLLKEKRKKKGGARFYLLSFNFCKESSIWSAVLFQCLLWTVHRGENRHVVTANPGDIMDKHSVGSYVPSRLIYYLSDSLIISCPLPSPPCMFFLFYKTMPISAVSV